MQPVCSRDWEVLAGLIAGSAADLKDLQRVMKREKEQVSAFIGSIRQEADCEVDAPRVPPVFNGEVRASIARTLTAVHGMKGQLAGSIAQLAEDYRHAEENEDRFVVLVFGEVNSGKTALANHVAGLDFDLPVERRGVCYEGGRLIPRLEEREIECTKEYQGFTLPGLRWIDCPGVLSTTLANSSKAHRLVSRADIILIVSSSDSPVKLSELEELRRIIERSGNDRIDACLVITKADKYEEDIDERGALVRRVVMKDRGVWEKQVDWCREQMERSGLAGCLRVSDPVGLSIFVARDAMGRDWKSGARRKPASADWEKRYVASGLPHFYALLAGMIERHGRAIKRSWPQKRMREFRGRISTSLAQTAVEVRSLDQRLRQARQEIAALKGELGVAAQEKAAGRVAEVLVRHHIRTSVEKFNRPAAQAELQEVLATSVQAVIRQAVQAGGVFDKIDTEMQQAFESFARAEAVNLASLQDQYRNQTYTSTAKSEAVGAGAGGALGAVGVGIAVGSWLGPAGALVGGIIGGLFGRWSGRKVGRAVHKERVTVRVKVGTNAEEVIRGTVASMRKQAQAVIDQAIDHLTACYMDALLAEVGKLKKLVSRWEKRVVMVG